ncbi:TPA: hypothetical protein DIC20_02555 [Candidatus Dependentiae bacterium]|nr:MAG: hypothetical protein US03_C0003G0065 [candidate division TM6 bacterium GW2011_GWF2_36_131]KKQ03384.1 MAG: hypothetical protein US13_C0003G0065 [candidate division TM6 bacterium GW2011_GWE2_36_25]KKQ18935.1 MAG: hypothetical protein US32_C0020G0007 [candidate division TM6 bacterium GW2011_GWA2_36_9]HBR70837.1 hypothetical protein [Candidatus Dependentiae bacterium]HCU00560.1 hypothetical protein [Candidatus Dependentiae bacterium]
MNKTILTIFLFATSTLSMQHKSSSHQNLKKLNPPEFSDARIEQLEEELEKCDPRTIFGTLHRATLQEVIRDLKERSSHKDFAIERMRGRTTSSPNFDNYQEEHVKPASKRTKKS